jgi:hypothetical protein
MAARNRGDCLVSLSIMRSAGALHLASSVSAIGIVLFVCEQSPLLTFQNHGLPARCPVCGTQNPLKGEQARNE